MSKRAATSGVRVAIVGAGFGGIAVAAALRGAGYQDVLILDRADGVGGVWRDNTYPGCACDIPAPLYSFSFAPNPDWTGWFPPQREILTYLEKVVQDLDLQRCLRLGTDVRQARWDEQARHWVLETSTGEVIADVLVPATGQLSRPSIPDLPGRDLFTGAVFHTGAWDHSVPLEGRRVAVVGTGASATQLIPRVARVAQDVLVFQRSAAWTLPRPNVSYTWVGRAVRRQFPVVMLPERLAVWGITAITGQAVRGANAATALLEGISNLQRLVQVRDPELREQLTPHDPVGCKRLLFTNALLPAMARPNVHLVSQAVTELTPHGVRSADGQEHEVDVIVYATGFQTGKFVAPLRIIGDDGLELDQAWQDGGPHAYLGMSVPSFPNMFLIYGPNTNTASESVLYFHERQAGYIVQAVQHLADGGSPLRVRTDVDRAYDQEIQARLAGGVWTACTNWYRAPDGRVVTNWPGTYTEYERRTRRLNLADFENGRRRDDETSPVLIELSGAPV